MVLIVPKVKLYGYLTQWYVANKITVDRVDIIRDMIKEYTKSHMLYVQHLEEEKKKKVLSEAEV